METDYIKLYEETYFKEEQNCEILILKNVKEYKKNKRSYNFCSNTLLKEFRAKEKEFRVLQIPYAELGGLYKRRLDEFAPEHEMEVITQTLFPEFKKIIHEDENYTFYCFITELAKSNAFNNGYRIFSNNYNLFEIMFKLNEFEEFKLDEDLGRESSPFYEKYRLKLYPRNVSFSSGVTLDSDFSNNLGKEECKKKEKIKNFNITSKCLLDTDNYFYSLTDHFINEKKTSFEDFKNVLLNDFESHTSEIHFFCSNNFARLLILSFKIKFKGKINLKNSAISKKFISSKGNPFSQSNLSHSFKTSEEVSSEILQLLE
jgi:hypothetical protein